MSPTSNAASIDICICTFRRPQLSDTLGSLARQNIPPGHHVEILVIDNDNHPSARRLVENAATTMPYPVRYVHCPAGNISIARNGALDQSRARYLAFIDDDEVADRNWLANLMRTTLTNTADVVLGPVRAVYASDAPLWMKALDIHSTEPSRVRGVISTGYTCNVLIDRASPAVNGVRFDLGLGQTGGEDTTYFTEVFQRGGQFAYAGDALIYEDVPPARQSFGWLVRRRFRMGQTHGRLIGSDGGLLNTARGLAVASAKMVFCAGATALNLLNRTRRNQAILRGLLHAGVISGLCGLREMRLYGPEICETGKE